MSYYWNRYNIVYTTMYQEGSWGSRYGQGVKNSNNPSYGYSSYGFSASSGYYMIGSQNTYYTSASYYTGGGSSITNTTLYDNLNGSANYDRMDKGTSTYQQASQGSYVDRIIAEYNSYTDNAVNGAYWYVRSDEVLVTWSKYNTNANTTNTYSEGSFPSTTYTRSSNSTGYDSYSFNSSTGIFSNSGTYYNYAPGMSGMHYYASGSSITRYQFSTNGTDQLYSTSKSSSFVSSSTSYSRGSFIGTLTASSSAYVNNARNSDGYWYVMGSEINYPPTPPTNITVPALVDDIGTMTWILGQDSNNNPLSTYVDLSIDGTTYKPIGNSVVGATTFTYDFTNEPATTTAILRFRHFDGGGYSNPAYSETFIIKHNIPPTAPNVVAPNGGEEWNGYKTIIWTESQDAEASPLRYHIQLSVDNGSTWKDIVALTDIGATSHIYYFKTTEDVSIAKVRIRAHDGLAYGAWDESNNNFTILKNRPPSAPTVIYPNGGELWSTTHEITWASSIDDSGNASQYNIQLSTNNGVTWKTIVALTALGATSCMFDFINEERTTNAKIRIRGFDGMLYGQWDESDNVFSLNYAPDTPTLDSLNGLIGAPILTISESPVFTWSYSHNADTPQSSYEIEIKRVSDGSLYWSSGKIYTNVSSTTKDMTDVPGEVLSWRVRVWDTNGGLSYWSDPGYFILNLPATVNTIGYELLPRNDVNLIAEISTVNGSMNTEYGFVYNQSGNPTTADTKIVLGTTNKELAYDYLVEGMTPSTYYFRAYALSMSGTSYGEVIEFTVPPLAPSRNQVGRLTSFGELQITGDVYERQPGTTKDIVHYFPFDGTDEGKAFDTNLLDYSTWKVGVGGTQGQFVVNGTASESNVISFTNPWGVKEPTWSVLRNDEASNADGGWNTSGIAIDRTKKYRLSVWIRRENVGDGRTYFGCQANTVHNLSTNLVNSNPYFISGYIPEIYDGWGLFVAYIHPSDYTGATDPSSGVYTLNSGKTRSLTDFKWAPTATVGGHRTYLYYSTKVDERQYWQRPRFELCDGSETTISDLLKGRDNFLRPLMNTGSTQTNEYVEVNGEGRIDIPFSLKPPYTINLWHKSNTPLSSVIDQNSSPMIFQMGDYYTNASISFWNYLGSLKVYMKGDTSIPWSSIGNYHNYLTNEWDGVENMYTLVAIDNKTFKAYMNGMYLGQQVSTDNVTKISYLSIANIYQKHGRYRDLSIHRSALTNEEILKLYKHTFQLTESGDLVVDEIVENPTSTPMRVYKKELHVRTKLIEKKTFL